ncbi:glycine--tRNA ligase [endosymbiont GvMRE of Glomus versiforme]|uniref:glycine--tRNA ligase n=1 Tax=endosymbiont GvMRE of Glomus versiforme TaxID=2039283 RepID=UPI000EC5E818|nr:glycine--tRNA ligase [endosymbiont GvMRE of Glomus versiforme]RHZ37302.1 Glycine--tRNA ligase [endosymbiont GvMRE of Glomus versiforme]
MNEAKDITSYLKHYGFFFPSAEIYQGLAKSWDCGPNSTELKRKLKDLWWKCFVTFQPYNVGSDSLILTHPRVLEASGHLKNFYDWLVECSNCQKRHRLDKLITAEEFTSFLAQENKQEFSISQNCPSCDKNKFTNPRQFNLLLSSDLQITNQEKKNLVYLRPETCQGIFINFSAIQISIRKKLPFGVGQIGKSFRNEITLHHGIFRTREFEQMELEFFCSLEEKEKWWEYWNQKAWNFLTSLLNDKNKAQKKALDQEELPHYAKKTTDLYFQYHFGPGELCSISDRGDYDLKNHSEKSGEKLKVEGITPHVIEVSFGVERLMLAILEDAYQEETIENSKGEKKREVLKLYPLLAPYFVAVIPWKKSLREKAKQIYQKLLTEINFSVIYEETDSIGKSYHYQDAIGTYYCLTVDDQTLNDETITVRERDSREQLRFSCQEQELSQFLNQKYQECWKKLIKI